MPLFYESVSPKPLSIPIGSFNIFRKFAEIFETHGASPYTVKRVDEVVRHPHLVTQDQFTQVSKKVSEIPAEDFTINIELFLQILQMSNLFDRTGLSQK